PITEHEPTDVASPATSPQPPSPPTQPHAPPAATDRAVTPPPRETDNVSFVYAQRGFQRNVRAGVAVTFFPAPAKYTQNPGRRGRAVNIPEPPPEWAARPPSHYEVPRAVLCISDDDETGSTATHTHTTAHTTHTTAHATHTTAQTNAQRNGTRHVYMTAARERLLPSRFKPTLRVQ
ncbi:hypothetical protein SARC_14163, partial [Sphaeroforma arctica JP610]